MNQLLGAHTSTAGGVPKAIDRAEPLNFTAIQIFTKNNNRWAAKPLEMDEVNSFKSKLAVSNIKFVVAHDSYLINLCAAEKEMLEKSRLAFIDEIERCELLGIPHLNFHPGAHVGQGERDGIKIIAESLNIAHEKTKGHNVSSMLEMTAGQGSAIGYSFEHMREIIDLVEEQQRMTVCIDTAHIFAAGYNIKDKNEYAKVMQDFDDTIGLERLKCYHMNDSKRILEHGSTDMSTLVKDSLDLRASAIL